MAKISTDADNSQLQFDLFDAPVIIPVNRLDADQYSADDIDGVTESIFGSGNMAYASLQASQADAAIVLGEAASLESGNTPDQDNILFSGRAGMPENTGADTFNLQQGSSHEASTATDRALDSGDISGTESLGAEGNFSHTTIGVLGASTLSSDAGSVSAPVISGNTSFNNSTGGDTTISTIVNNVTNVAVDDTVQNVVNTVNETVNNITNLGDEIVENILEGDVQEVVNIVNNQVNELTETVNTQINNVTETVNNILQDFGVTEITNEVTEVTNQLTENVTNTVNEVLDGVLGAGGLAVNLDTGILSSLGTGLNISVGDSVSGSIGTGLVSDNISALTESLTGLSIPIVADTGLNIGFDLLNTGGSADDGNDISVAGLDLPDIALDPIEGIVGDIDINLELPTELLDPQTLVTGVENLVENLGDISLADPGDLLGILGGQGAEGTLDIVAGDTELGEDLGLDINGALEELQDALDISDGLNVDNAQDILPADLPEIGDIVENISDTLLADPEDLLGMLADTGSGNDLALDVDGIIEDLQDLLNVDAIDDAVDLLLPDDGDLADSLDGVLGNTSWTESTVDVDGLFDDLVDGIGGATDSLPDPIGTVAEGLGALNPGPHLGHGGLGGLFG